jgi:class 3 adenylate cyclase
MRCLKCGTEGIPGKKFCAECGSPLSNSCSKCASDNPPDAKFCADCGNALGPQLGSEIARPSKEAVSGIRIAAERITSDTTEGERKTVTALFADIKGSMELMEDLDPEEARAIVDPALRLMMDAVHRYDGYSPPATGSSRCSGRRWLMRTIRNARFTPPCGCRRKCAATRLVCGRPATRRWRRGSE